MTKLQLKDLKLSIPEISIMESRQLMGGMSGYLPEVVVIGHPNGSTDEERDDRDPDNRPNQPEHDDRDNNIQTEDTQHGDNDQSSTDDNQHIISTDPKIVDMLDKMSPKLIELLKSNGVTIQIDTSITTPGAYYLNANVIALKEYDMNVLYKECVHAIQDSLGILSEANRFNNEFQEHIIGDLLDVLYTDLQGPFATTQDIEFYFWITESVFENNEFNKDAFMDRFDDFMDKFRELYSGSNYNVPESDGYDWNWDVFFELFNIK